MSPLSDDEISSIVRYLSDIHCCVLCIHRFIGGVKNDFEKGITNLQLILNQYLTRDGGTGNTTTTTTTTDVKTITTTTDVSPTETMKTVSNPTDDDDTATVVPPAADSASLMELAYTNADNTCPACVGVLQYFCNDQYLAKIVEQLTTLSDVNYDSDSFCLSLQVPIILTILDFKIKSAIKKFISDKAGSDISSVKDVFKWIIGSQMIRKIGKYFHPHSGFLIHISFISYNIDKLCEKQLSDQCVASQRSHARNWKKKLKLNENTVNTQQCRNLLMKIVKDKDHVKFRSTFCDLSGVNLTKCTENISMTHASMFIAGRYNKFSRELSQTPWIIDGVRKLESSVKELICETLEKHCNSCETLFSSSGREDIDVRMLGKGRPFIIEVVNPKRTKFSSDDMKAIEREVNSSTELIFIRDLQIVSRDDTVRLKEGETEKTKTYSALVWTGTPVCKLNISDLSNHTDLVLQQITPIRVLHRRPLAIRERTVQKMSAEFDDENHFKLTLQTQAGTYIKEFVHGDFGRTQPNIGTMLDTDADIVSLDVESVDVDWPPALSY